MERDYERELAPICAAHDVACLPYFGLAMGFLTGKYRPGGDDVDSPRAARVVESYLNERGVRVLDALDAIAAARGVSDAAVALAWLAAQPTVATPVASARSPEQLAELLQFVDLDLDAGELERLSARERLARAAKLSACPSASRSSSSSCASPLGGRVARRGAPPARSRRRRRARRSRAAGPGESSGAGRAAARSATSSGRRGGGSRRPR